MIDNIKNVSGWRSRHKLVIFSVDDYGAICLNSKSAKKSMLRSGVNLTRHIEKYDALETREDLEALFETLVTVRDANGRNAVFTANALCANLDFAGAKGEDWRYRYLTLPETFEALAAEQPVAYEMAWKLWQEGIDAGYLKPQSHGREHANIDLLERKVRAGDETIRACLSNRSMAGIEPDANMEGVKPTEAFSMSDYTQLNRHMDIIRDGLNLFEKVFGYRSATFVPPGLALHPDLYAILETSGIKGIDKPQRAIRKVGLEEIAREWNTLGLASGYNHISIVRNVVFEPTKDRADDSVALAMQQIAAAFRWGKPAIVSSHRVNFGGHIDESNRKHGLQALGCLLREIVQRWPDVQFTSADELVEIVLNNPC